MKTYNRLPISFERGEGVWLWDTAGHKYLDAISGIAVCSLGHAHPAVTSTLCEQAGTLVHTSNLYGIQRQQELADKLCSLSGMDNAFFCNSGAEANEAAIKIARLYGHNKQIKSPSIIVMEGSFHGRTMATLSATGNRKIQAGFEPLVQGFIRAPYNDVEALHSIAKNSTEVVAVLVEPILGEGGIQVPADDYLNEIRQLCTEQGWLMMLDEIQTGMCRTGKWFAHQHNAIKPDVMTLAKAMGNGVPIGCCLAHGEAAEVLQAGNHGSTFGGNPLMCGVSSAVIDVMQNDKLEQRATDMGAFMLDAFQEALGNVDGVTDIRGKGLMIGIELEQPCGELVSNAVAEGLLINVTANNVIRLLPPLVLEKTEATRIVTLISRLVEDFLEKESIGV